MKKASLICLKNLKKIVDEKKVWEEIGFIVVVSCKECVGNKCNKIMWIWLAFTQWPQIEDWLSKGEM